MFKPFLVFACVGKHLDLTRAAADLGMSEAAVSRQLRVLESDCGISLYRRTDGTLELTEAGRILLARINAFLAQSGNPRKASADGTAAGRRRKQGPASSALNGRGVGRGS